MKTISGIYRQRTAIKKRPVATVPVVALVLSCFMVQVHGDEPVPEITDLVYTNGTVEMALSNLAAGGTYYVERVGNLSSNSWAAVDFFEGTGGETNWQENVSPGSTSAFYRVVREAYHPKVGQSATLITRFHGVSGTAHIINNRTIELRNFNYDGQGLDVVVFIAPDPYPAFQGGTTISGNLVGPAFVNETLQFTLPAGHDLNTVSYISIWCIDIPVSFGDGQFY